MTFEEPSPVEIALIHFLDWLSVPRFREYIRLLHLKGNERVLDYGSGAGFLARILAGILSKGGGRLTCVDSSTTWVRVLKSRLARFKNVDIMQGNINDLNIPDEKFDVVLVQFVIHNIPAVERLDVLEKLVCKLNHGGKFFLREPLGQISIEEITRLLKVSGLVEEEAEITRQPLMGMFYVGVFKKST